MRTTFSSAIFTSIAALIFLSCATKVEIPPYGIIETDEKSAANCEFLGDVDGWVEWERKRNKQETESARFEAYNRAALLGATHIIWVKKKEDHLTSIIGRAYLCR